MNPTSDKFPDINTAMEPISCWNNGSQNYGSGYMTFNEYMTWALFSIYLYDNFDKTVFEERNAKEARFMANGRGFIKFREFNDFVLEWYKAHPETSLEALFPAAIQWSREQNCKS